MARHRLNYRKRVWATVYKQRIRDGLEHCRHCGSHGPPGNPLTFGHLVPHSHGGNLTLTNTTILCELCNIRQDTEIWPHLVSLAREEATAALDRRWSLLARLRPLGHFAELGELLDLDDLTYGW